MSETKLPPRGDGANGAAGHPPAAAPRPVPLECAAAGRPATAGTSGPLAPASMFMRPDWLADSAWLEHVPFAFWLVEAVRPRLLVEVGTGDGVSYFAFCQAVERLGLDTLCYGVAVGAGDAHAGIPGEGARDAVEAHNRARHSGFSRLLRLDGADAPAQFADGTVDLLHIDGRQPLEALRRDLEAWRPRLSERAVVLLHGSELREEGAGAVRLAAELGAVHPCFAFTHGAGLAVLGVGAQRTEQLERLFAAATDADARAAVRAMFARVGRAAADARRVGALDAEARGLATDLERTRGESDDLRKALDRARQELASRTRVAEEAGAKLQSRVEQHAVERGQLAERATLLEEIRAGLNGEHARLAEAAEAARAAEREHAEARRTLEATMAETRRALDDARGEAARKDEALAAARSEVSRSEEALGRATAELAAERDAVAAAEREDEAARAALAARGAALNVAEADLAAERQTAAALRAEIGTQRQALDAATMDLEAERQAARAARWEAEAARDALASRDRGLHAAMAALAAEREACAVARAALRATEAERETLEAALGAAEAALATETSATAENERRHGEAHDKLRSEASALREKLGARIAEITRLTGLLREADARSEELQRHLEEVQEARAAMRTLFGRAVVALGGLARRRRPRRRLIRQLAARLGDAGLLDRAWYLEHNHDVAEAGVDPAEHFLLHGALEGREPCDILKLARSGPADAGT